MNRQQRRQLEKRERRRENARRAQAALGEERITTIAQGMLAGVGSNLILLRGGPMDGWLVTYDAQALKPGWGKATTGEAKRYKRRHLPDDDGTTVADWIDVPAS